MEYEKDLMASWDDYALKQTLLKQGIEQGKAEVIQSLIAEMGYYDKAAAIAKISVSFVRKVRQNLKK